MWRNVRLLGVLRNRKAYPHMVYSRAECSDSSFNSIKYWITDRVANIQLCRPQRLNAIDVNMPFELEKAVEMANDDPSVKVIYPYCVVV